jgi:hypothetical protein
MIQDKQWCIFAEFREFGKHPAVNIVYGPFPDETTAQTWATKRLDNHHSYSSALVQYRVAQVMEV